MEHNFTSGLIAGALKGWVFTALVIAIWFYAFGDIQHAIFWALMTLIGIEGLRVAS